MSRAVIYRGGMALGWGMWLAVLMIAAVAWLQTPRATDAETLRLIAPTNPPHRQTTPPQPTDGATSFRQVAWVEERQVHAKRWGIR